MRNCRCRNLWILHFTTPDSFPQICEPYHVGQGHDRRAKNYHAELSTLQHRFPNFFLSSSTLLHPFSSFHAFLWLCALPSCLPGLETPFQRPARGKGKARNVKRASEID